MTQPPAELSRNDEDNSALARRRRIQKRNKGRDVVSGESETTSSGQKRDAETPEEIESLEPLRKKPHPTGIKRQARYDPGVPMTRDELTAWRKEARRVRNRESAAASRKRTRERIEELEGEVSSMTTKYKAALARIMELEAEKSAWMASSQVGSSKNYRNMNSVSPSPSSNEESAVPVSPPASPRPSMGFNSPDEEVQHIMNMIGPPAVKISGAEQPLQDEEEPIETDEPLFSDASNSGDDNSTDHSDLDMEMGDFLADALTHLDPLDDVLGVCAL